MKHRIGLMIASLLAVVVSIATLIEGTSVLLGLHVPDQIVLPWLVRYNVAAAVVSLVAVILLWLRRHAGNGLSLVILFGHVAVLLILAVLLLSGGLVAIKSILAMSMRSVLWAVIVVLLRR